MIKSIKIVKRLLVVFILLGSITQVSAQNEVDDCAKFRSLYYQYLKQSMWRDAMNFWTKAYNVCTAQGEQMDAKFWKNGLVGYLQLQKEVEGNKPVDEAVLTGIKDTIGWIYEERIKIEDDKEWKADYANFLFKEKDTRYQKIDSLYIDAIHSLKSKASYADIRYYFTHLILNKFNKAEKENQEAERENIIEEYIILSEYVGKAIKTLKGTAGNEKMIGAYEGTQAFLDQYFLKVVKDCDALVPVMEKKFVKLSTEKEARLKEVKKYLSLLDSKSCQKSEIYAKYLDERLKLDPTAEAYYFKGNLEKEKENLPGALKAYEKALELEGSEENKDKYQYYVASTQSSLKMHKAAYNTAKGVNGEYKGKALEICAYCIAALANSCGDSTFERKSNYWLANDYIQKAIANGADISSGKYLSNAPDDTDIFNEGKEKGQTVALKCWGDSTTIR